MKKPVPVTDEEKRRFNDSRRPGDPFYPVATEDGQGFYVGTMHAGERHPGMEFRQDEDGQIRPVIPPSSPSTAGKWIWGLILISILAGFLLLFFAAVSFSAP